MDRRDFIKVAAMAPVALATLSGERAVVAVDASGKLGVKTLQEGVDLLPEEGGTLKVYPGLYGIYPVLSSVSDPGEWLQIEQGDPPYEMPISRKGYIWCGTCWKEHRKDLKNCRYSWDNA